MRRIKMGVIGLGWFGEKHLEALETIPQVEIYSLCTRTEARLLELQDKFGAAKVFTDYNEMLADPELEAVSVTTMWDQHKAPAVAALQELDAAMRRSDNLVEQQRLNHEFHRQINRAAGSQRLASVLQLLSRSLPMPYADFPAEWLDEANHQHRDIVDAFRRRDAVAAQRAMDYHITASARHAIEVLERLDFFEDE